MALCACPSGLYDIPSEAICGCLIVDGIKVSRNTHVVCVQGGSCSVCHQVRITNGGTAIISRITHPEVKNTRQKIFLRHDCIFTGPPSSVHTQFGVPVSTLKFENYEPLQNCNHSFYIPRHISRRFCCNFSWTTSYFEYEDIVWDTLKISILPDLIKIVYMYIILDKEYRSVYPATSSF